jgi:transcriptional regulator with XRE-family HTH domain
MNAKTVGARLRTLRGKKTIREVANDCGIPYSTLAMYENGHRVPKDSAKIKLAKYYNTSVEALFFAQ